MSRRATKEQHTNFAQDFGVCLCDVYNREREREIFFWGGGVHSEQHYLTSVSEQVDKLIQNVLDNEWQLRRCLMAKSNS